MANAGREAVVGAVCQSPILGAIAMAVTIGAAKPANNPHQATPLRERYDGPVKVTDLLARLQGGEIYSAYGAF
jgi:hypothetical protein